MRNDLIKYAALFMSFASCAGCSTMQLDDDVNNVIGKFQSEDGSTLNITKGESANEYRVSAEDIGKYLWTSVGFYRSDCRCIESVFQYDSHKNDYGDTVGIHRFSFYKNNDKLVKLGGWKELDEFPEQEYTRQ